MQIFLSDKGGVYVIPMSSVSKFLKVLEMFTKEVELSKAVIIDSQ